MRPDERQKDTRKYLAEACNSFLKRKEYDLEDHRITNAICDDYESEYDNCIDQYGYDYDWSELIEDYVKMIIEGERLDP